MKNSKNLGSCNDIINWDAVKKDLLTQKASVIGPSTATGKEKNTPEFLSNSEGFIKTKKLWDNTGFKSVAEGGSAEWHMFYPGTNFDERIINKFVDFYNISSFNACWISMIMPGRCAPWHVDQYKTDTHIERYHCHIGECEIGHVFILEDEYYTEIPQGYTYKWNDVYAWHTGFNAGVTPKFMFNLY